MPIDLAENAPAKINLTLRVLGRRDDGYHDIESLVVFAELSDRLTLAPGGELTLSVSGPRAAQAGQSADNLVLKAARALAARIHGVRLGAFHLDKSLPVAAGIGGGSADAAAALRLLARANDLEPDDPRLYEAAHATGADVPVCLSSRARLMRGVGEKLSGPLALPPLHAMLVNPGVALATRDVFASWVRGANPAAPLDLVALKKAKNHGELLECLAAQPNDLEGAAVALAPVIAEVLDALRSLAGCRLARMSGSGATCFGLFESAASAQSAATLLQGKYPKWWVQASALA